MRGYTLKTIPAAVLLALTSVSTVSIAQDNQSRGLDRLLEEVVVTARKREESLQDAPISISAFTGEALEYRGVTNISQIAEFTPNLTFQNNPSFGGSSNAASVYLRGVGQKEFLPTTEPGVGIYVDGVYIARSVGAILDLVDVERVEVLRGPQGTLFGRNTIGGAISLTTRKPAEEFGGNISITAGDDSRADIKARIDMPLSDKMRTSLSIASFNRDGYVTRDDGIDLGDDDTLTARGALSWDVSESLSLEAAIGFSRDRENGPALTLLGINHPGAIFNPGPPPQGTPPVATIANIMANLAAGGPAAPCAFPGQETNLAVAGCYDDRYVNGPDRNSGTAPAFSKSDLLSANVNLTWDTSDSLTLKSITAIRDLDSTFARDGDHSPVVVSQFFDEFEQEQFTQELQLLGSSDRLNWILGAYYFDEDGFNANLLDFSISSFRSGGSFKNEATAVYAQGTYDVSDKFSATLGLRYTKEDKSFTPDQIIFNNPFAGSGDPSFDVPFLQAGERVLPFVEKTIEIKETSPFVNLAYQINDNMLAYATYSKGFKSGGFTQRVFPPIVAGFTAPAGTPDVDLIPTFDPEFVTVTELGFKFSSDDNRLVVNGAIFSTDYKDLQVQVFEGVAPVTKNAGQASLSGFEIETQYIPGGGWFVSAGLGYIDAEYDQVDSDTLFSADNAFERVPEWTASASVSKEFILEGGAVLLPRLDWSYRSETFNDTFNTAMIAQDGYSTVNGSIAWLSSNEKLRLTFGVTNLTDEEYLVTGVAGDAFQSFEGLYARQREWYATYAYEF